MNTKLGPKPDAMDIDAYPEDGDYYFDMMCWERHRADLLQARAERAEELLREAQRVLTPTAFKLVGRIAEHFKEVAP